MSFYHRPSSCLDPGFSGLIPDSGRPHPFDIVKPRCGKRKTVSWDPYSTNYGVCECGGTYKSVPYTRVTNNNDRSICESYHSICLFMSLYYNGLPGGTCTRTTLSSSQWVYVLLLLSCSGTFPTDVCLVENISIW